MLLGDPGNLGWLGEDDGEDDVGGGGLREEQQPVQPQAEADKASQTCELGGVGHGFAYRGGLRPASAPGRVRFGPRRRFPPLM